jgi:hypothetical protein
MGTRVLTLGVKRPVRGAHHSLPSSAQFEEWVELYLPSSSTPSWRGAQFKKAQIQLYFKSRDNSVGIALGYGLTVGVLGFNSRRGLGIFFLTTASRPALGPTQPPFQWVSAFLSLGVKRSVHEGDHSPPSNAEVKEWVELYLHSPNKPSWRGALLKKHRDNFTFTFTFKRISA